MMKAQSKLVLVAAILSTVMASANAAPGIRSQKLVQCKSEPRRVGDSAVGGQFAAVVTREVSERHSHYQVKIYNAKSRELVEVLTGGPNQRGHLVLNHSEGISRPGFSQTFTLIRALGTWSLTSDFGPENVITFICLK